MHEKASWQNYLIERLTHEEQSKHYLDTICLNAEVDSAEGAVTSLFLMVRISRTRFSRRTLASSREERDGLCEET